MTLKSTELKPKTMQVSIEYSHLKFLTIHTKRRIALA